MKTHIPPLGLGVANLSQEIQCKDRRSSELPHQYFAMLEVKLVHTFLVKRNS